MTVPGPAGTSVGTAPADIATGLETITSITSRWMTSVHRMRVAPRRLWFAAAVIGLVVASCGSDEADSSDAVTDVAGTPDVGDGIGPVEGDITVFAAASLTAAFTEIGEAFVAANPDADVAFNFAGSSDLVTQITHGAPTDVFASADLDNMDKLADAAANGSEPVVFATNRAEIIVGPDNPKGITSLDDLADPELIVVQCAPEVPCGTYADQIFANAGITVTPKSWEENAKAVVTKVTLGEADAGIVYATDVIAAGDDAEGVAIADDANVVAEYPVASTAEAPNPDGARAFIDFLLSDEGQAILAAYGFLAP